MVQVRTVKVSGESLAHLGLAAILGFKIEVGDDHIETEREWEFPRNRFIEYEPRDVEWCKPLGIGRMVDIDVISVFDMEKRIGIHTNVAARIKANHPGITDLFNRPESKFVRLMIIDDPYHGKPQKYDASRNLQIQSWYLKTLEEANARQAGLKTAVVM
jgi:hypothetical protein